MREGPDIARIGSLIGDPARANMLTALMSGKALTATELAAEAGVTLQTASSHLGKLQDGGLVTQTKQGRHRYFTLAGSQVSDVLEALMGLAARSGHLRTRTGPKDPALRKARICYDHLAGDTGVRLFDSLYERGFLTVQPEGTAVGLTDSGSDFIEGFGIDLLSLKKGRRPLCRACLDWSARRSHLAGALGAALFERMQTLGWARRDVNSRAILVSPAGGRAITEWFPIQADIKI
ncbi:ArsR family transcriptional regulator [Roseibium hamelinense]|uniref:ArsR family transcriptional regulator n=1 Tax=Roseibium hamelinense TaxID=150831 RepID=A0A562TKC6_9HYPH|nr:metalloregulator ArsR/SmtB family transcription factor [Roseibium hamelinense]MTI42764.1 metalloregulator ArsR/SmtB family transcription factor [Roseibium hamelinense]TWI93410.1 ArsR family transcriptional regulator [Roseibium hamelinense]